MLNYNKISGIYILTNPVIYKWPNRFVYMFTFWPSRISKSLQSAEISLYLAFTNELNVAQKEKNIDEWLIWPNNTILLMKSQLVNSYTLKHHVNRCFWNPDCSKCKHVYKPVGSFKNSRVCQYVNTTVLIVIEHYIAI
jgi:hypothetical protein